MLVIPAINETAFDEVLAKINIAAKFSPWIHLDVVDGRFAANTTWNSPEDLKSAINSQPSAVNFEAHLMVEDPGLVVEDWISAGVKRIIVHVEAITDSKLQIYPNLQNIEIGIALNPETPTEDLLPYLEKCKFVLVLGVNPGLAGQKFNEQILEKIKFLKTYYPSVIVEADGGINPETARLVKEAGADIVVSASYIWNSKNPEKAYKELISI